MEELFELEYQEINKRFKNEIKTFGKNLSYSITGTPLRQSNVLIVGSNWGGTDDIPSQIQMPLINDILADQNNQTYKGYLDFFVKTYNDNKLQAIDFLNRIVYTNGNFIRTPSEKQQYNEVLNYGYSVTAKYLKEITELIGARIIICFGNSERSATSAVFKSMGIEGDFWKVKDIQAYKVANNFNTYFFSQHINGTVYKIFSFPHSSRFNTWKKGIEGNEVFKILKSELNK